MLLYAHAQEEVTWCSVLRAKQGHMVRCFACEEVTWYSVSRAKQGHVVCCFTRKEVTWYSVSRAKQGHVGSDIWERKEAENGVRSTANQKTIPP
ncbi:hypothetical protein chiPu_0008844 [Chiloscyllium punctatum]|uniref:Uncharacterized protein n=1 Tax=Chiloscyllium punctatum TaxID=137246 RepID=A0A401SJ73_CHIPU|nr:hypothetical protein [Chiloscyllium punctatum]